jgi:hypothetical protein
MKRQLLSFRSRLVNCFIWSFAFITCSAQDFTFINKKNEFTVNSSGDSIRNLNKKRLWLVGATTAAAYGGSLIILSKAWYDDYAHTSFQVFNDSREWLQVDKLGHGWTAYNTGRATAALWQWGGLSQKKAALVGSLSGFAYLTGIEFMDSHSAKWGWSWSDMGTNILGSSLFLGQELLWKEQRVQYKFSFHGNRYADPILKQRADELFGERWYERMLKDYNAQTYWFSTNIKSFIPDSKWPAWLNIAIGYGARGMYGGFENKWSDQSGNEITRYSIPRRREFYFSPDIDFTKIKTKSKLLRTGLFLLNSFKCPAPALLFSKGRVKAYAFYF